MDEKPDDHLAAMALDAAQDGLWDWDCVSGRIFLSPRWKAITGHGPDQLGDDPREWFSRIHPDDRAQVKKGLRRHSEGKTGHFRSEHRIAHADGSFRWVLARGTAVKNASGKTTRIVGTLSDIDDRKGQELQQARQLDELRFALASEKILMEELDRKNRELMELSITDGLTGLYNHRFLMERFEFELKRVRRYGGALSCLLIDIDRFKSLNDTYGHQFGDHVIRKVASIIREKSREVDICGRYGGEEFMVISNLDEGNAALYASKLRDAIENNAFRHPSTVVRVTVSIGIAEYRGGVKNRQALVERADQAMYQAKSEGRNSVCVWKETEPGTLAVNRYGIDDLRERLRELADRMRAEFIDSAGAIVRAMETGDPPAGRHSANVARYAAAIAEKIGLSPEQVETVRFGALLHDIGKVGIPGTVLLKATGLNSGERRLLERHPELGIAILKDIRLCEKEIPIVLHHHERYDGTGFPQGLKGREIPLGARIVAVADAFDSMTSGRNGLRKWTHREAREALIKDSGRAFSPDVVDAFAAVAEYWKVSSAKRGGSGGKRGMRNEHKNK